MVKEIILSIDGEIGEYICLICFFFKVDIILLGSKSYDYFEEVFIVSGCLYD